MAEDRVIKKYANRRLYDAAASRHVTLGDIKNLIVAGDNIRVVDDKTGQDITRSILLQIIADQEQMGEPILSTEVLESIVRFYGNSMQGFMSRYIDQSVRQFLQQQQALQQQFARLVTGTPFEIFNEFAQTNLALWQQMQESFLGRTRSAADEKTAEDATPPQASSARKSAKRTRRRRA